MKKTLLSLLTLAAATLGLQATTVTFDFTKNAYGLPNDGDTYVDTPATISQDGVSILLEGGWRMWSDGLREYKSQTSSFTVSAGGENITSVSFTAKSGAVFVVDGTSDAVTSWSGNASSVKFVNTGSTGNAAVLTIVVTYGEDGSEPGTPDTPTTPEGQNVSFDFTTPSSLGNYDAPAESGTQIDVTNDVIQSGVVSLSFSVASGASNTPRFYYGSGNAAGWTLRFYKDNTMKVTVADGYIITGIEFDGTNIGTDWSYSSGSLSGTTWTPTSDVMAVAISKTATGNNPTIKGMTVYYKAGTGADVPDTPDTPDNPQDIPLYTVAEALQAIAAGTAPKTAQVKGIISEIKEVSTSFGNATYFIKDALTDSESLEVYRGYWLDGAKFTAENQIAVGATVVVEGELVNYNGTYEFTTGSKIVSYNGEGGGDTPVDPNPGDDTTPEGYKVSFDFTVPSSLGAGFSDQAEGGAEITLTGETLENGVVTLSFAAEDGASNQPRLYYGSGNSAGWTFRFYNQNSFKVVVDDDYILTGVVFDGTNIGTSWSYSDGSLSGSTWKPEGDTNFVTFSKTANGNNPAIKTIDVYYIGADESAIESVEVAGNDAPAEYYNLQGQRVSNPASGLYIVRQGNKVSKVIF